MTGKYGGFFRVIGAGDSVFRGDVSGICLFGVVSSGSLP